MKKTTHLKDLHNCLGLDMPDSPEVTSTDVNFSVEHSSEVRDTVKTLRKLSLSNNNKQKHFRPVCSDNVWLRQVGRHYCRRRMTADV